MIGYLRGEILENSDGKLILLAGTRESGGSVGYSVFVPQSPNYLDCIPGKVIELFVHTHVREDALDLYGFCSRLEKELFLTLLSVNGIGPKGALGMLSKVNPEELVQAVLEKDKDALTQVPGIGKKTAERVVMELADPLRKKVEAGLLGGMRPGRSGAKKGQQELQMDRASGASSLPPIFQDAKAALVGLGYREQDVTVLLNRVLAETETPPKKAEDLVRVALRQLL